MCVVVYVYECSKIFKKRNRHPGMLRVRGPASDEFRFPMHRVVQWDNPVHARGWQQRVKQLHSCLYTKKTENVVSHTIRIVLYYIQKNKDIRTYVDCG